MVMSNRTFVETPVKDIIEEVEQKQIKIGHPKGYESGCDIQTIRFKKFINASKRKNDNKFSIEQDPINW